MCVFISKNKRDRARDRLETQEMKTKEVPDSKEIRGQNIIESQGGKEENMVEVKEPKKRTWSK